MEQAPYLLWTNRKPSLISTRGDQHLQGAVSTINIPVSYNESISWEEQAFAEDATGALGGGCIWPPRSYSCSFCRREFRSAQALGGHMNVHRRDRAMLKHSSPTNQNQLQPHHQDHRGFQYHPSVCGLAYQHPNSRVSALAIVQESTTNNRDDEYAVDDCNYNQQISTVPPFYSDSTISQEHKQRSISFVVGKCNEFILDLNRQAGEASQYGVESDRSVSLNLVLHQTCSSNGKKRRRSSSSDMDGSPILPLFLKARATTHLHHAAAELELLEELCPNTTTTLKLEDLDLELRL